MDSDRCKEARNKEIIKVIFGLGWWYVGVGGQVFHAGIVPGGR